MTLNNIWFIFVVLILIKLLQFKAFIISQLFDFNFDFRFPKLKYFNFWLLILTLYLSLIKKKIMLIITILNCN
jgi:hypothetical protein